MSFNEWKVFTLEEICSDITDGSHSSPKTVQDGYPMASVKDMEYNSINIDSCRKISKEDYLKLVKGKCKPILNDVLIAKDGSYMKHVNVIKEEKEMVLLSSIAILRPKISKLYPDYLKYYLLNPIVKSDLEQGYVSGSVIRRIVLKDFKRFPITLPSIEEQKAIAKILSDLDSKIEVNNKINKRLEDMAQSIFKHWFVDFEFPNEEGKPYKSSGGEMVDSELGMIPKGWEIKTIDDIVELIIDYRGKTPKKLGSDWSESGVMAISAKNIKNNKLVNLDVAKYVNEELYEKWMKDRLRSGDVLMTSEAPLGELYYLADYAKYCLSQRVYALRSNEDIMKKAVFYYMISSNNVMADIMNRATGTTVVGIRQVELRKVKMIIPCIELQNQFNNLMNDVLIKINRLEKENEKLISLRDTLLPKLMSGEIRVPQINKNN